MPRESIQKSLRQEKSFLPIDRTKGDRGVFGPPEQEGRNADLLHPIVEVTIDRLDEGPAHDPVEGAVV